jgi:D-alanyl-D-alanine carboxypeptidase
VGACEKNDLTLIGVSLNSGNKQRFADVAEMFDYGYANYKSHELMAKNGDTGSIKVKYGHNTFVDTVVPEGAYVTLPKDEDESIADTRIVLKDHVTAPIKKGTKVGSVEIYEDGDKIGESDIVISRSVEKGGPWAAYYISDMAFYAAAAAVALLIIFIIMVRAKVRKDKRRKRRNVRY